MLECFWNGSVLCWSKNRFLLPDFHSSKKFFCFFAKLLLTHLWTQIPNLNSVSLSHYLPLKEMGILLCRQWPPFFIYLSWLNPNLRPPYYPPNQPWISGNLFISLVHPDQSELKTRYILELTILSHLLQSVSSAAPKTDLRKKTSKSIWFLHKTSILTVLESQTKPKL